MPGILLHNGLQSPPMGRRLFKILSAVSLVLFVGISVAQYRGFANLMSFALSPMANGQKWFIAGIFQSRLCVDEESFCSNPRMIRPYVPVACGFHSEGEFDRRLALSFSADSGGTEIIGTQIRLWSISIWYLIAGTAVLPVIQVLSWLKPKRPSPGHCRHCGYDLRATPERCPECGTAPTKPMVTT